MASQFRSLVEFMKKTGDRLVIVDEDGIPIGAIMDFEEYERFVVSSNKIDGIVQKKPVEQADKEKGHLTEKAEDSRIDARETGSEGNSIKASLDAKERLNKRVSGADSVKRMFGSGPIAPSAKPPKDLPFEAE